MENDKLVRLSDAVDALRKAFTSIPQLVKAKTAVESIPAVDAVEVVRCRECKFNPKHEWTGCPKAGTWREFNYDGFCSDGKRREDGDGDG